MVDGIQLHQVSWCDESEAGPGNGYGPEDMDRAALGGTRAGSGSQGSIRVKLMREIFWES